MEKWRKVEVRGKRRVYRRKVVNILNLQLGLSGLEEING